MYNLLLSLFLAALVFAGTFFGLQNIMAALVPAILVFAVSFFLIARRIGAKVMAEMEGLQPLLEQRKIQAAEALMLDIQKRYRRWQFFLAGQLDAQRGMVSYMQLKFDDALPLLERGQWRNWAAQVCIGAIHQRKGDTPKALAMFEKASKSAGKEPMVYVVWATVLTRNGKRQEALKVLADSEKRIPDHKVIRELRAVIANKKKIDPKRLPQTWYQFFPEDMMAKMVRGRRGGPPPGAQVRPAPFPMPKTTKRMRRGG